MEIIDIDFDGMTDAEKLATIAELLDSYGVANASQEDDVRRLTLLERIHDVLSHSSYYKDE